MSHLEPAPVQLPCGHPVRSTGGRQPSGIGQDLDRHAVEAELRHQGVRIDERHGCITHIGGAHGTACRARPAKPQLRSGAGRISPFAHGGRVLQ